MVQVLVRQLMPVISWQHVQAILVQSIFLWFRIRNTMRMEPNPSIVLNFLSWMGWSRSIDCQTNASPWVGSDFSNPRPIVTSNFRWWYEFRSSFDNYWQWECLQNDTRRTMMLHSSSCCNEFHHHHHHHRNSPRHNIFQSPPPTNSHAQNNWTPKRGTFLFRW